MKTKLLRKLRKKARKTIVLVQTGEYDYKIRKIYHKEFYKTLSCVVGAWPLGDYIITKINELRRDYILSEVKRMRKFKPPKIINI